MGGKAGSKFQYCTKNKSLTAKVIEESKNWSISKIRIAKIRRDAQIYVMNLRLIEEQIEAIREYLCSDCRKIFDSLFPVVKDVVDKYDFLKNPITCIKKVGGLASLRGVNEAYRKYPFFSKSRISQIKHAYEVLNQYLDLFEELDLTLDHLIDISYEIENYVPEIRLKILQHLLQILKKINYPRETSRFRKFIKNLLKEIYTIVRINS